MEFQEFKHLTIQTFKKWRKDNTSRLAAALAYYAVFAIPPIFIIVLAIAGQVFSNTRTRITAEISNFLGETGSQAVVTILENVSEPSSTSVATIFSVIALFFGASGAFGQLQGALNTIWEVESDPDRSFWETVKDRFFSFVMVLGVGFLFFVSMVISALLSPLSGFIAGNTPGALVVANIIDFVVSFAVITLLLALVYKIVPDVKIEWKDVWIGAVVTALLLALGKWGVSFYLSQRAPASTYGAAGSIIIILLWVFFSAQIFFLGAEFTQVYANRYGSSLEPEPGAIPVRQTT